MEKSTANIRLSSGRFRIAGPSLVWIMAGAMMLTAAIGVSAFQKNQEESKDQFAGSIVEKLNEATDAYNHAFKSLDTPFLADTGGDEMAMLMTLQYEEPIDPKVGEPFVRPDWKPTRSKNTQDYRYVWRGQSWDLLKPGEAGAGLKVQFDESDIGEMVTFPPGYGRPTGY